MYLNPIFHTSEDMVLIIASAYVVCKVTINITSESASIQNCSSAINISSVKQSFQYYILLFNLAVEQKKKKGSSGTSLSIWLTGPFTAQMLILSALVIN